MKFRITYAEFIAMVDGGVAESDSLHMKVGGAINSYEHICVRGNDYSQTLHLERHGYSWRSAAEGSYCYLEAYNGDIIEVAPIRYTKKGHDLGDTDPQRISDRFIKRRGGAREGAGRKPSGLAPKKVWSVKVTEEEEEKLRAYLKELRER